MITLNVGDYALNPHLYSKLSYDPSRDFAMIGMVTTMPMWLVVEVKVPVNTAAEFIAYVKSQPPARSISLRRGPARPSI